MVGGRVARICPWVEPALSSIDPVRTCHEIHILLTRLAVSFEHDARAGASGKLIWSAYNIIIATQDLHQKQLQNFDVIAFEPDCHYTPTCTTMPLEHDPQYTVVLRGTRFNLTSSQINFDGPNYLTSCFLGDSRESQTRILELPRSPDLFPIIMDYLCGYVVLPLDTSKLSSSSICYPEEKAVKNLRADADFYKLEGLKKVCDDYLTEPPKRTSKECIVIGIRYPRSDENDLGKVLYLTGLA